MQMNPKKKLRATFLLIIVISFLASCSSGDSSNEAGARIYGAVYLGGQPVSETNVQIRLQGEVIEILITDSAGEFAFQAPSASAESWSLSSNTGQDGQFEAVAAVAGGSLSATIPPDTQFIWVTELTSLVHDYLEAHPETDYNDACQAVASSLGIPTNEDITRLSDADIFDPATFEQAAAEHGGLATFLPQVAAQIDTLQFDFSVSDPYKILQVEGQDPHHQTFEAEPTSIFGNIGKYLASKMLGQLEKAAWGWFFGLFGSNSGPSLSDIVEQLTAIQDAINLLAQELRIAFTEQKLENALNALSPTSATLRSFAVFQRDANSNRPPVTDEPAGERPEVIEFLNDPQFTSGKSRVYATQFFNYLLGRDTTNIITGYNALTMLNLGWNDASSALSYYDIRFNDNTRKLQNNLNFGLSNIDLAVEMLANAAHSSFLRDPNLGVYPENQLPVDIGLARSFILAGGSQSVGDPNNDSAALRRRALQLVPPRLPRDDVVTLPTVEIKGDTPTLGYRGNWQANTRDAFTAQLFTYHWLAFPQRIGAPWEDFMEWGLPTRAQMQAIDNLARILGNGDPKAGLQRLGFFTYAANVPNYFHYRGAGGGSADIPPYGLMVSREVYVLGAGTTTFLEYSKRMSKNHRTAAIFVRGSLSGDTQAQADTILAMGTTVKPTLTLNETSPGRLDAKATYRFSNNQEITVDVTDRVEWLSSTPAILEVSNMDSDSGLPPGVLIGKTPGTATITASMLVDSADPQNPANYVTAQLEVTNDTQATLKTIEITPRNRIYTATGNPAAFFYCTAYLGSDSPAIGLNTYAADDLTSDSLLKWTLLGPDGNPVDPDKARLSSAFDNAEPTGGILRLLDNSLATGTYVVKAEYFSSDDSTVPLFMDEMKIGIQVQ